ncbi:MAG: hypothetical protein EBU92_12850 [Betaproteobacteria bacterium]|nr:hypothetical protein [Betaproteobacteria bacterium]
MDKYAAKLIKMYAENPTDVLEKRLRTIPLDSLLATLHSDIWLLKNVAARENMKFLEWLQKIGATYCAKHASLYVYILLGAAKSGNKCILEWMRKIGVDDKFYLCKNMFAVETAIRHDQIQFLAWYKENIFEKERWSNYYAPKIIDTAVQLGSMKVVHWLETFGPVQIDPTKFDTLVANTIFRGNMQPLRWLQKIKTGFTGNSGVYYILVTLAENLLDVPEHWLDRTRMLGYTKEALEWLESMGVTAEQFNRETNELQKSLLSCVVKSGNTVMLEWLAMRLTKENFAAANEVKFWVQVQTRLQNQKILVLVLAARRMRLRAPPPEVWVQCVKQWLD